MQLSYINYLTDVQQAIIYGCKVAGAKCGMERFNELKFCNL